MDPASAVVAFVGFAASLATLAGLALNSLQILNSFQARLKNAPKGIQRLITDLKRFEALLSEIGQQYRDGVSPPPRHLSELWEESAKQMQQDLGNFKDFLLGFERRFNQTSITKKSLTVRVRLFFQEDTVEEFQRRLCMHVQFLSTVQSLLSLHKLDSISITTSRIAHFADGQLGSISTSLEDIKLSTQAHHETQQQTLDRLQNSLQALLNSRSRISTLPYFHHGASVIHRQKANAYNTAEVVHYKIYNLPIGHLQISAVKQHEEKTKGEPARKTTINIVFVPPWLLSKKRIRFNVSICHTVMDELPRIAFGLSPISVNQSAALFHAMRYYDVVALRRLFSTRQAGPTDHFLVRYTSGSYSEPMSLVEATLSRFRDIVPCSRQISAHQDFLAFLLEQGSPVSLQFILAFFKQPQGQRWAYDRPWKFSQLFAQYFASLSALPNVTLEETVVPPELLSDLGFIRKSKLDVRPSSLISVLVSSSMGFDAIPNCLLRAASSWHFGELNHLDKWLVGILAYTDEQFRRLLKTHLQSYWSSFSTSQNLRMEEFLEMEFGIGKIKHQVNIAPTNESRQFLEKIVTKGTLSMLTPFLDLELDRDMKARLLGLAALRGDACLVEALGAIGSNGAWALPLFLTNADELPTHKFEPLLSMLLGYIRGGMDHKIQIPDPLVSFLRSDKAYATHPEAVKTLFDHRCYNPRSVSGSRDIVVWCSQIGEAIRHNRPEALTIFLGGQGVEINAKIGELFSIECCSIKVDSRQQIEQSTWLTFATHYGRAQCVRILLEHGANPLARDSSGRTALEIAREYVSGTHLRQPPYEVWSVRCLDLSLEEDLETVNVLEEAIARVSAERARDPRVFLSRLESTAASNAAQKLYDLFSWQNLALKGQYFLELLATLEVIIWKLSRLCFVEVPLMLFSFQAGYSVLLFYEISCILSWLVETWVRMPRFFLFVSLIAAIGFACFIRS